MNSRDRVDGRMLQRERSLFLLALVALQALFAYIALTSGDAGSVAGSLIGLYAVGLLTAGVYTDHHRTPAFNLALCGGVTVLAAGAALLVGASTFVGGALGFGAATLYSGWTWHARSA